MEMEDLDMEESPQVDADSMDDLKMNILMQASTGTYIDRKGPASGLTAAVPRLQADLEALLFLTQSKEPILRQVRGSSRVLTAFYGFGDASSSGFGASIERPDGLHTRYGLWPSDVEEQSSNYRELKNLVDTVEEEASADYLRGS